MTKFSQLPPLAGLLALPLFVIALWSEWADYYHLWNDSIIYHHGFLVAGAIAFLLFLRRDQLLALKPVGSFVGIGLLFAAVLALILSQAAEIRVFRLLLTPVIIVFWGWSIWGFRFVKVAGGPVMLLVFAAPIWDDFSPLLQHITVFFNQIFLGVAEIPATIKEFFIILEVGTFLVEDGCSGVRYLMIALFLGAFYGQLYYTQKWRTVALVVIAGLLSMLANWIRVFGIIVAGHYTNMETSLVEDHELFGWVIFVLVTLLPLYFIVGKLEGTQPNESFAPKIRPNLSRQSVSHRTSTLYKWLTFSTLLLLVPSAMPHILEPHIKQTGEEWELALPNLSPEWRGPLNHASFWHPMYLNPDFQLTGVYVSDDLAQVQLDITGYRTQSSGKELVSYDNKLFNSKLWTQANHSKRSLPEEVSKKLTSVNEAILLSRANTGEAIIVWYWFQSGSDLTASSIKAKIYGGIEKLTGDNRGALWALASPCRQKDECSQQREGLSDFMDELLE